MRKFVIAILFSIPLLLSVYFYYSLISEEKRETEELIRMYTESIKHTDELNSGLKGDSPLYYYMEFMGRAFAIADILQSVYRESGYWKIYTDVPYDLRSLFTRAFESENKEEGLRRLYEVHTVIVKHLNEDVIKDPMQYHYAYIQAQSEIREKKLIDEKTMAMLGW